MANRMNESIDPTRVSPKRWVVLSFLLVICFVSHFNRASITNAGDERIMEQYGISPARMGMVYSSFLIVYTIFMIPGGWLIDRRGPGFSLALMLGGSAVFCAATGSLGFGHLPPGAVWVALLLVRAAMGLFSTPLHPGAARSIDQWFASRETGVANGLVTGASILAYAVVHTVFGRLIDWIGWPGAFLLTGGATFILAICWWWVSEGGPASGSAEGPATSRLTQKTQVESPPHVVSILASPPVDRPASRWCARELVLLTLSYAAVGYFQYLFFYWLHYYFDQVLRMDKIQSRYYAGLPSLAMAAAMPVGGWLMGRLESNAKGSGKRFVLPLLSMLASAACLLAGLGAARTPWVVSWFTAALGFLGLCESAFWVTAIELGGSGGKRAGMSAAIMNTGGNGIGLLAPMLTPLISRRFGWGGGLCVGALVAVAGAMCWLGIRPRQRAETRAAQGG